VAEAATGPAGAADTAAVSAEKLRSPTSPMTRPGCSTRAHCCTAATFRFPWRLMRRDAPPPRWARPDR
jgi:hypothetical protein